MDRIVSFRRPTLLAAALSAGLLLAATPVVTRAQGTPSAGASAAPSAKSASLAPAHGIDGLIAHLHEKFMITPAQEDRFQKLAAVMRDNAATMSSLARKRSEGAKTMTAIDDLKSYAEISAAHAEGSKKMIPVFQALYDSMSDVQKQAADAEFRSHYSQGSHKH